MATSPTPAAASVPTMKGPVDPGGRDCDPRAGYARYEREDLGHPDGEGGSEAEVLDRPPFRKAVGQPEENPKNREQDGDLPRLAKVLLDDVLTGCSRERGRNRGREHVPRDPLVGPRDAAPTGGAEPCGHVADDVAPEVHDDGDERAQVERDVEGLVEVRVRLEVAPVREPRDEDQVSRGRDRQQLGQALHDSEYERLPVGEGPGAVADACGCEQDGQEEECARGEVETRAADVAIVCA